MDTNHTGPPKTVKGFLMWWLKKSATNLGVASASVLAILFSVSISSLTIPDSLVEGTLDPPTVMEEVLVVGRMPEFLTTD